MYQYWKRMNSWKLKNLLNKLFWQKKTKCATTYEIFYLPQKDCDKYSQSTNPTQHRFEPISLLKLKKVLKIQNFETKILNIVDDYFFSLF